MRTSERVLYGLIYGAAVFVLCMTIWLYAKHGVGPLAAFRTW